MVNKTATRARLRVLLVAIVSLGILATFLLILQRRRSNVVIKTDAERATGAVLESLPTPSPTSTTTTPAESPSPSPTISTPSPADTQTPPVNQASPGDALLTNSYVGRVKLIIPVAGVKPEQLRDTFADARSEGRVHDAIDIPAPAGTPVLAAADGEIMKLFLSDRGGTTIYQASVDRKLIYYYAHLQGYAAGLAQGKFVKQGEVIGYVGDTGNAGTGNFHLHFSIAVVADPKRYWEGTNINPYPLLKSER